MAIGGGGFNAERFRKYVAYLNDPSHQEAANAFKLALDELAKNNLRFSDLWVDAEESKRAIKESSGLRAERDKYRAERDEFLDRCARQQAEATELEKVIDRLHDRIQQMEEKAVVSRQPPPHVSPAPAPPRSGSSHMSKIYDHLATG